MGKWIFGRADLAEKSVEVSREVLEVDGGKVWEPVE